MRLLFQCEECDALHKDVDAANKCKHRLHEEIDLESQSVATEFVCTNQIRLMPLDNLQAALSDRMARFTIDMIRKAQRK